jgi:hypothetical protein
MPTYFIDPLYPHWLRCDLCGKGVAEVLLAEALDLESLTARQVADLCPAGAVRIDAHEHSLR